MCANSVTDCINQSPVGDSHSSSATQNIPRISWKRRVCYFFHKADGLSLSWARWIQTTPLSSFFQIHFNIILLSMSLSSKRYLSFSFSPQPCVHFTSFPYVPHGPPISFYFIWSAVIAVTCTCHCVKFLTARMCPNKNETNVSYLLSLCTCRPSFCTAAALGYRCTFSLWIITSHTVDVNAMFNTLPYVATLGLSPYQLSRHSLVNATKMKDTKNSHGHQIVLSHYWNYKLANNCTSSHGLLPHTTGERYTNWHPYCSLLFFESAMLLLPIAAIER